MGAGVTPRLKCGCSQKFPLMTGVSTMCRSEHRNLDHDGGGGGDARHPPALAACRLPMTDSDCVDASQRAKRFSGAYTGTSGTLAAYVLRLLEERRRLIHEIAALQAKIDK